MTRPFCSHGVTTVSWAMCTLGSAGDDGRESARPVRASRSSTFTNAAAASNAGQEAGEDEAALAVGGEADARLGGRLGQRRGRQLRRPHRDAVGLRESPRRAS